MSGKRSIDIGDEVMIRVMASAQDVHYTHGLVNGAWVLSLFGDIATEIAARYDGDGGLLRHYSNVDFLAPIFLDDFIEAVGKLIEVGNTSRTIELEARKIISAATIAEQPGAMEALDEPVVVAKATAVTVVPKNWQRYSEANRMP